MGVFVATTTSLATKMIGTVFDSATAALASACIVDAENEVKKYISKRYDIAQFTTTTSAPLLSSLAETLAVGFMYENMSRGSKEGGVRADRYIKRAMENLLMIREGEVQLFDSNGALITETDTDWRVHSNTVDYSPTFNEDNQKNWRVDRDKLDDIKDERDT